MGDISRDGGESATGGMHHTSWSVNLEKPEHAENQEAIIEEALDAIEHTAASYHVNLVTSGNHGHPSEYLYSVLEEGFDDELEWEFVEQCGCGGYVTRVYV